MTGVQTCALPICFPVTICGDGISSSITGSAVTRGGGGGARGGVAAPSGGAGGGGAGSGDSGTAVSGTANTGGGGGGTRNSQVSGAGGSGIVIFRYSTVLAAQAGLAISGGTVTTTSDGYTVHTFTSTGSATVTVA